MASTATPSTETGTETETETRSKWSEDVEAVNNEVISEQTVLLNNNRRRRRTNKTNATKTMINVFKANMGIGVLSMPKAFANAGLYVALVATPLVDAACVYCMLLIVDSHNRLCERFNVQSLNYEKVAEYSMKCGPNWTRKHADKFGMLVFYMILLLELGACTAYIIFVSTNLRQSAENIFDLHVSSVTILLILLPVFTITCCLANLKVLSLVLGVGNAMQIMGLSIVFANIFQFVAQPEPAIPEEPAQYISADFWATFPLFLCTSIFSVEGIGTTLPIMKEMRHPNQYSGWCGLFNVPMMFTIMINVAMGFYGYLTYGSAIQGSITLNLPKTKLNETARLAFALSVALSYALQFYVVRSMAWPILERKLLATNEQDEAKNDAACRDDPDYDPSLESNHPVYRSLFTFVLVSLTFVVAYLIPRIDLFISFIGAFCTITLALIIPALIDVLVNYDNQTRGRLEKTRFYLKNMLIMIFGIVVLVTGTYLSVKAIVDFIKDPQNNK